MSTLFNVEGRGNVYIYKSNLYLLQLSPCFFNVIFHTMFFILMFLNIYAAYHITNRCI